MDKDELKELGKAGFILGPEEKREEFVQRIAAWRRFGLEPGSKIDKQLFKKWRQVEQEELLPFFEKAERLLAISPSWLFFFYSNDQLTPWQAGATWIIEGKENCSYPLIQLRDRFGKKGYLFYSRTELFLHELIHAVRAHFNERRYEEHLAYALSEKKIRRLLGPLFRTPSETIFFLLSFSAPLFCQALFFLSLSDLLFSIARLSLLFPCAVSLFFFLRLFRERSLVKKAFQSISLLFPLQTDPLAIAIRMSDEEISLFATLPTEELLRWVAEKQRTSLRWKQIVSHFPLASC